MINETASWILFWGTVGMLAFSVAFLIWCFVGDYRWLSVIGYWLLVIGYWLLVIGYWLSVIIVGTKRGKRKHE